MGLEKREKAGMTTDIPGGGSPGGDTEVSDEKCLDASEGFGPGFTCEKTDMWCGDDSGDGVTVGYCCPKRCQFELENKNKNSQDENERKRKEQERKNKRAESGKEEKERMG